MVINDTARKRRGRFEVAAIAGGWAAMTAVIWCYAVYIRHDPFRWWGVATLAVVVVVGCDGSGGDRCPSYAAR